MSLEFGLILNRENIRDEFYEEVLLWAKAVISYCQCTQKRSSAIQHIVSDCEFDDIECK